LSLEIVRHHDAEDLAATTAARLATTIARVQSESGSASVVLTGGRIAGSVLFALADPLCSDAIDWSRIDIWWGDERYLPAGDAERNDDLADRHLLSMTSIDSNSVHRIAGPDLESTATDSATTYARQLSAAIALRASQGRPAFDIVLLSIGSDGHIASLFPESSSLHSGELVMAILDSPKAPPVRVSMGLVALNNCTQAWLLASGGEKALVVDLMLTQGAGVLQIPAAGIEGVERTLLLIDESAASKLATDIGRR